jgi:hypothetical protein
VTSRQWFCQYSQHPDVAPAHPTPLGKVQLVANITHVAAGDKLLKPLPIPDLSRPCVALYRRVAPLQQHWGRRLLDWRRHLYARLSESRLYPASCTAHCNPHCSPHSMLGPHPLATGVGALEMMTHSAYLVAHQALGSRCFFPLHMTILQ